MMIYITIIILLLLIINVNSSISNKNDNDIMIQLPRDDGYINSTEVQWWYWTGHLKDSNNNRYGYEMCFFIVLGYSQLLQVAITDVNNNKFSYKENFEFTMPSNNYGQFNLISTKPNLGSAVGSNGQDILFLNVNEYSLNVTLSSDKPAVLHYNGLPHHYSFGGYTYYYSRTKMSTKGTLSINDVLYTVEGNSWFDRQYGLLARAVLKGWQWFAIELDSNVQVMLFDFIDDSKEKYGSITYADGRSIAIDATQFNVTILNYWTSPHTNCKYPSGWEVSMSGLLDIKTFQVIPMVLDQELKVTDSPTYWEGAAYINDNNNNVIGSSYVELNGYCSKLKN